MGKQEFELLDCYCKYKMLMYFLTSLKYDQDSVPMKDLCKSFVTFLIFYESLEKENCGQDLQEFTVTVIKTVTQISRVITWCTVKTGNSIMVCCWHRTIFLNKFCQDLISHQCHYHHHLLHHYHHNRCRPHHHNHHH